MGRQTQVYEIKLRTAGDRGVDSRGETIEGGKIFSRHIEANNPENAAKRAKRWGRIVSITKVHKEDIIGMNDSMNRRGIIGVPKQERRRERDVILDNVTLVELVFSKNNRRK